jgi:hypothetical protein
MLVEWQRDPFEEVLLGEALMPRIVEYPKARKKVLPPVEVRRLVAAGLRAVGHGVPEPLSRVFAHSEA